jgi:putative tryptophan/tyrosine transport system substrate-binding protein
MQFDQLRRREFTLLLGGAAAAWPLAARPQQQGVPVIGFLSGRSASESSGVLAGFRKGLHEAGYDEGTNVHIAFRWGEGHYRELPALASDLAGLRVTIMVAAGGEIVALAAKTATSAIPVVFVVGTDPVKAGLVASLSRPGGNVTGVTLLTATLGAKRLGLVRDIVPATTLIAVLVNPLNSNTAAYLSDIEDAARSLGQNISILRASTPSEIDAALAEIVQRQHASALVVIPDAFFSSARDQLVSLAAHHALPAIFDSRENVAAGGLMSYGTSYVEVYHQAGIYVGRILKGAKPTDLPVLQPTKFEFVINLKTARALGLNIPPGILAIADEVIE